MRQGLGVFRLFRLDKKNPDGEFFLIAEFFRITEADDHTFTDLRTTPQDKFFWRGDIKSKTRRLPRMEGGVRIDAGSSGTIGQFLEAF